MLTYAIEDDFLRSLFFLLYSLFQDSKYSHSMHITNGHINVYVNKKIEPQANITIIQILQPRTHFHIVGFSSISISTHVLRCVEHVFIIMMYNVLCIGFMHLLYVPLCRGNFLTFIKSIHLQCAAYIQIYCSQYFALSLTVRKTNTFLLTVRFEL